MTNPLLAPEELQHLHELREVLRTAATPGWAILIRRMEQHSEDAREDLIGAVFATDTALAGLTRRWQQREAMVRGLKQYIQACEDEKEQLLLAEDRERSSDAEQDREIA